MTGGPPLRADALFVAELNERLFAQFVRGRWCAALSARLCPALAYDGLRMVRIACADDADLRRALAGLSARARAGAGDPAAAYETLRDTLPALRAREGFDDPADPPIPCALPPEGGPLMLLSAAATPVAVLAGALIAGAGRGLLWKPAPGAAASAHLMMRAMGPACGGGLALVQGDHGTGAAMAGRGALIWASAGVPPVRLGAPVLSLSATAPRRR